MKRSLEVQEAIDYFDVQYAKAMAKGVPVETLRTQAEEDWIDAETRKCRSDFRYAAGNYFYIIEKNANESLLDLWEAQELLWEVIQWLWRCGKPAWIIVNKARQLGFSCVVQALIAWTCIFFRFKTCLIVADDPGQSEWLFNKMLHIYDRLPYWMQPMIASRRMKEGIVFDNPNYELRRLYPGNSSAIIVESANKLTSIGQGKTIHGYHVSELSSVRPEAVAREIIEEDLEHSAVEEPGNFGIVESTPKGKTNYFYQLWATNWPKGRRARYFPFYAPAFMENRRRKTPPAGFLLNEEEIKMKEEYASQWNSCQRCGILIPTDWLREDQKCFRCGSSDIMPVLLGDDQIYWYREKVEYCREKDSGRKGQDSLKKFYQEMSISPMQGFQITGIQAFPDAVIQRVQSSVKNPEYVGRFDESGRFHYNDKREPSGLGQCSICGMDHDDDTVKVWELPKPCEKYHIGIDTSEGLPDGDFSVAVVIRIGRGIEPDEEVAVWRDRVPSDEIARNAFLLGNAYNKAQIAIECRTGHGDLAQYILTSNFRYNDIYWWKHYDTDPMHMRTKKMGWFTNCRTRTMLFTHLNSWVKRGTFIIRSQNFLDEAPNCVKDDDQAQAGAEEGYFDDEVMATMIASFTANDENFDAPGRSLLSRARASQGTLAPGSRWECRCDCGAEWQDQDPRQSRCPKCGKIAASARRAAENGKRCRQCGAIWSNEAAKSGMCLRCRAPLDNTDQVQIKAYAVMPSPDAATAMQPNPSTRFEDC